MNLPPTSTPLMNQYFTIKKQNPEAILFYRLGDFYEMFGEDAKTASHLLGITLTSRFKGDKAIPMCGVPHFSATSYIQRLLKAGHTVALCEQVEEPRPGHLVGREVVRLLTPGTLLEEEFLDPVEENFLLAYCPREKAVGLSWLDISTGAFHLAEVSTPGDEQALLEQIHPREIILPESCRPSPAESRGQSAAGSRAVEPSNGQPLTVGNRPPGPSQNTGQTQGIVPPPPLLYKGALQTYRPDWWFAFDEARETLTSHFQVQHLDGFGCGTLRLGICAAGAALQYAREVSHTELSHITRIQPHRPENVLFIDEDTFQTLELVSRFQSGEKTGSLLDILDRTKTAAGTRLLRTFLQAPLVDLPAIHARQDAVAELVQNDELRRTLQQELAAIQDLERMSARLASRKIDPVHLIAFKTSLDHLAPIKILLQSVHAQLLHEVHDSLTDKIPDFQDLIAQTLHPNHPNFETHTVIRSGHHTELDELKTLKQHTQKVLSAYQEREIKATGIPNLKVGYNQVIGYYLEVSPSHFSKVPSTYLRKQTLKNVERFTTPYLKNLELKILRSEEHIQRLERELYQTLIDRLIPCIPLIQKQARLLSELDVYQSLAQVAKERHYVRPEITSERELVIEDGQHPLLEVVLGSRCIPNDTLLNDLRRFLILTGPNMAGKSTYIRQVALLVILAQMGSFIPAKSARIGVVDRLFARIGASDDITQGKSTFMVEMAEVARLLHGATSRSLVILDEVGRGTSTFDGVSLAWSICEYLHDRVGCRTLFATHYHELIGLETLLPSLKNVHTAVHEWEGHVLFLHKIMEGPSDRSYGIYVAKLAGLPQTILQRAKTILRKLENSASEARQTLLVHSRHGIGFQHTLFEADLPLIAPADSAPTSGLTAISEKLHQINVEQLTPLEALHTLQELKDLCKTQENG